MKVLPLQPDPPENVIKTLEEHLAAARVGNMRGLVIVYENPLGGTGYAVSLGDKARPEALIARLQLVITEMCTRKLAQEYSEKFHEEDDEPR